MNLRAELGHRKEEERRRLVAHEARVVSGQEALERWRAALEQVENGVRAKESDCSAAREESAALERQYSDMLTRSGREVTA